METSEAKVPPKPTTDATADLGKMSEMTVYIVADQPWGAAAARAKDAVASQRFSTRGAKITGRVQQANKKVAVLRARFKDQPRLSNQADNPPPPILPSAVTV